MDLRHATRTPTAVTRRRRATRAAAVAVLVAVLAGCGSSSAPPGPLHRMTVLAAGDGRTPGGLSGAARSARRFATTYASHAYRRRALAPPGADAAVRRALAAAADRVPRSRRRLRPRLLRLHLSLRGGGALAATAWIGDGRFPPFSVGFTVARRAGRWTVTSISLPD